MDTGCVGTEERSDEVANDNSPIMAFEVATDQSTVVRFESPWPSIVNVPVRIKAEIKVFRDNKRDPVV